MSTPAISHVTDTSLVLSWTVPFDDTDQLEFYDIRYGPELITAENFAQALRAEEGGGAPRTVE